MSVVYYLFPEIFIWITKTPLSFENSIKLDKSLQKKIGVKHKLT